MSDEETILLEDCQQMRPIDFSAELPRHSTKVYGFRTHANYKRIVVHTTDWHITPQVLAEYDIGPNHISKTGCPGITYHEIIMPDGAVYKTLPYSEISWHVGNWNKGSIGIALMYRVTNASGRDQFAPSYLAMKSLQCRLGDLCLELGISPKKVYGHRELRGTGWFWAKGSRQLKKTCPGMQVDLDQLRYNVALYTQLKLRWAGQYNGAVDGIWGPVSIAAFNLYLKG